jgi:triacylglycerol lipase
MSTFDETPIVLVHGILGFDRLGFPDSPISYFRGIAEALNNAGYMVPEPPALSSAGSVKERAADVQNYLENHEAVAGRQVHLIAHSMGGLDSRYAISHLRMADRVLSLTTLGTPHGGTSIADFEVSLLGGLLNVIDSTRLVDLQGFFDLTIRLSQEFAQEGVEDPTSVRYYSVAGVYHPASLLSLDLLRPTHDFILKTEKADNDGLVSVTSANFGTFLGTWPGDHFRLINWPTNIVGPVGELVDHSVVGRYVELVRYLAREMP